MLVLAEADLEGVGVRFWRQPKGRRGVSAFAWPGLILLDPALSWPHGFDPKREETWRSGVRVVWLARLGRFQASPSPVPSLSGLITLKASAGLQVRPATRPGADGTLPLLGSSGEVLAGLPRGVRPRIEQGVGKPLRDLRLRLLVLDGRSLLLVFGSVSLRAIAALDVRATSSPSSTP